MRFQWVSHNLTEQNELDRINVDISHLARHKSETFLVTGDDK